MKRGAVEEVASLKTQPRKDMLVSGSISLAQALMQENAIDEYRLVLRLWSSGADAHCLAITR